MNKKEDFTSDKPLQEVVLTGPINDLYSKLPETKDYRRRLGTIYSVGDWERLRRANMTTIYFQSKEPHNKATIWACACGSREFHLREHGGEITVDCAKCGNSDIFAWYENGHIRHMDGEPEWSEPKIITDLRLLLDRIINKR